MESSSTPVAAYAYNGLGHRVYEDDLVPDTRRELIYSPGWQLLEERLWWDYENDGDYDQLSLIAQNIWGLRYIDDLIARRAERGTTGGSYAPPDGSWAHGHLSLILSDSMFSVRRIIGDDWGSTTFPKWTREWAALEIDYTAYGEPDAIAGITTDPWVDFDGDGDVDNDDVNTFLALYSATDLKADRNVDSAWTFADVQAYSADASAGGATLTPTGRLNEEENPFGLAGYRHDAITGLYHVRHRVLDPEQGKWLQRDPAGFVDGWSVYQYAGGSPALARDPLGLVVWEGQEAAIISWVRPFNASTYAYNIASYWLYGVEWAAPTDLVGLAKLGAATTWHLPGMYGFLATANRFFPPPQIAPVNGPTAWGSKEHRGFIFLKPEINCCDNSSSTSSTIDSDRLISQGSHPGYTPDIQDGLKIPAVHSLAQTHPTLNGTVSSSKNSANTCVTYTMELASRVGLLGRTIGWAQNMGRPVPYISRRLDYTICCDGSVNVKYKGTHFPSHRSYFDGAVVATHRQYGIGQFMFTAGGSVAARINLHAESATAEKHP